MRGGGVVYVPSFDAKRFPMYCTGNNIYDKQVQGGSVHIIEPGTLCVYQKTKSVVCEVLKEGKIK